MKDSDLNTENSGCEKSAKGLLPGTVEFRGVSKRFKKATIRKKGSYSTVKSSFVEKLFSRNRQQSPVLTALNDLSITVQPGDALGIVGRNGSGKSTLLKLIAGIYQPDSGEVLVSGRISALIELGAGFHPDFTGRENVYLGGIMYGLSRKEIEARFDKIVAYAELEDFIDDPVRTYSSGMYMRLGFSLAVHTEPDILLVDEVLAVGDAGFINRCKDTISDFKRKGKTLIFVTHDLESVKRWCDEAIWLNKGVVCERGEPQYVIDKYLSAVDAGEEKTLEQSNAQKLGQQQEAQDDKTRWGSREVEISDVKMFGADGESRWVFRADEPVTVEFDYRCQQALEDVALGVGILRHDGLAIHGTNTELDKIEVPESLSGVVRYRIEKLLLTEGSYFLDVAAHRSDGFPYDYHHRRYQFSVRTHEAAAGIFTPEHRWELVVTDAQNLKVGTRNS